LVKDLIDPSTHQWNHQVINKTFLPFEANQIYQIPLLDRNSTDELTWAREKDGRYTVKSGYKATMEWKTLQSNMVGSTNLVTNPQWKYLWKLKIPPKQANLLWRIFQNALPVSNNLKTEVLMCALYAPGVIKGWRRLTMCSSSVSGSRVFGLALL
jgi:hypothetical protein